jgi:hypothetical protein
MAGLSPDALSLPDVQARIAQLMMAQSDMYGPGLGRPAESKMSPLPWLPYGRFMPIPGEGPVFRTNPQGPVRNIAGTRRA